MTAEILDSVIVGSGPAGLTAAIYMARADRASLVIDGPTPGGQLTITTDVENFPGFPEGIMGPALIERMRQQAERLGTRFDARSLVGVRLSQKPFEVDLSDAFGKIESLKTKSLIIATGASARLIGLDNELELMGSGVSACATCDGFFYKDKDVAVVGGGDSAMEEALYLARIAKSVTIIHRREGFRASKIMLDRAQAHPKIRWALFRVVEQIHGSAETGLSHLTLRDPRDDSKHELKVDGLFVAIGHTPNTEAFRAELDCDAQGYLKKREGSSQSSIPGVFVCGDVSDPHYRQAITAAASGCMAAIDCKNYLDSLE